MQGLLKFARLFLLLVINVFFLLSGIIIGAAFFLPPAKKMGLRACGMQWWARFSCLVLGIHIARSGSYGSRDVFFIASNHCSYLDILVIGAAMPSVFVSKSEVASWPLLGRMAAHAGTVFVNRESKTASVKVLDTIKERLACGVSVVVFPEGTTSNGLIIRDFKSTFFKAPIDSSVPVLPVSVAYSHINRRPVTAGNIDAIAWYADMDFLPHFWNLLGLGRVDARIYFNVPLRPFTGDRKTLSSCVFDRVREGHKYLINNYE